MSKLSGLSLLAHLDSLFSIHKCENIYGYPTFKIYRGHKGYDFSVKLFDKIAATPMGPAAGPHTQLAQNILLSYLAGSRVIELKTIQILDQLDIPRPCIDMRNIGFNVEWSQELSLDESFKEYLHAWILIHLIKEHRLLGKPVEYPFYDFVFDTSVGYDLKGIQSKPVQSWLNKIQNAEEHISKVINSLPQKYKFIESAKIPSNISDSVTISTFHGCPPDEIEEIVKHLIRENQFNVVIKLNPTLLGYEYVNDLLRNKLGYKSIKLDKSAFHSDLDFESAIRMISRLKKFAKDFNHEIGVKFTNTLVVKNNEDIFTEPVRYLSGAPLYVIAMHSMYQFREKIGWDLPISFSGGINKSNFSKTLAYNIAPVTACTDILKKGGYSRFNNYMQALKSNMDENNSNTIDEFILKCAGLEEHGQISKAGQINAKNIIKNIDQDTQYSFKANNRQPKKIQSRLKLFDCINCNICIPVCPNAANFSFKVNKKVEQYSNYKFMNGSFIPIHQKTFAIEKDKQIGNIAEFCNNCGNCDTFCPEMGAPFEEKPQFYLEPDHFKKSVHQYGFYFVSPNQLYTKIDGKQSILKYDPDRQNYSWNVEGIIFRLDESNNLLHYETDVKIDEDLQVDLLKFVTSKIILNGLINYESSFPSYLINTFNKI